MKDLRRGKRLKASHTVFEFATKRPFLRSFGQTYPKHIRHGMGFMTGNGRRNQLAQMRRCSSIRYYGPGSTSEFSIDRYRCSVLIDDAYDLLFQGKVRFLVRPHLLKSPDRLGGGIENELF
jgi:hypothetical protein